MTRPKNSFFRLGRVNVRSSRHRLPVWSFAPTLAALFLGYRMRGTWLTQGKGNPPEYVQAAMYCATYAVLVLALALCVLAYGGIQTCKSIIHMHRDERTATLSIHLAPHSDLFAYTHMHPDELHTATLLITI